jgi:RNA polymerase sigma-70 factor (ECF subfamily)
MALYAGGNRLAFRRLFEILVPKIRAFFLRSFPDRAVADDLTQATFLKLHGARASYQADRPLKPWVFTIAASVRRDELRRRYSLPHHVGEAALDEVASGHRGETSSDPSSADCGDSSDTTASADAVRAAIGRLPESLRVVVQLHQYEERTFEEIAKILGTTPGAARVRASRAYERLRAELRPLLASSKTT